MKTKQIINLLIPFVFLLISCGRPTTPFDRQHPFDPASEQYNPGYVSDLKIENQNGTYTLFWHDYTVYLEEGYLIEKSVVGDDEYEEIGRTKHTEFTDHSGKYTPLTHYRVTPYVYRSGKLVAPSPRIIQLPHEGRITKFDIEFVGSSKSINISWDTYSFFDHVVVIEVKANNNEEYRTLYSENDFTGSISDPLEDMSFDDRQYRISLQYSHAEIETGPLKFLDKTSVFNPRFFYPVNFIVEIQNNNTLRLEWTDNSFFEDGFKIYRSNTFMGGYEFVVDLPPNTTEYQDSFDFETGEEYWYRLHAYTEHSRSIYRFFSVTIP